MRPASSAGAWTEYARTPDSGIELDHQILILDRGRFPLSAFGSRFWPQATQNTKVMPDRTL